MKSIFSPRTARALAPLLAATALVSTSAFAQDAGQAAPPPVVTPPSSATVPIPPVTRTVPDGQPAPAPVADAPARTAPRAAPAPRAVTRAPARPTVTRAPVAAAPAPAPAAEAPVAPPVAPPADTTAAAPPPPVAAPEPAPAPAADSALTGDATTTTTATSGIPLGAWLVGGIAILAVILGAAMALRRRKPDYEFDEPAYVEDTYVEPAPVAVAPIAAAPIAQPVPVAKAEPRKEPEYLRRSAQPPVEPVIAAPDEVQVASAPREEVAALTAGNDHAERPWLEFAMRPVRAGTNVDEALVEIELTVGNAGSVDAKDVRISTFLMSGDVRSSEMERLLTTPPADSSTDPVTIKPGEGKRIDATLALLKSDMGEILPDSIRPIVVADARYTMADGTEGRTSASFVIGVTPEEGEGLEPLELSRSSMHDNVGAELHGEPQHA